MRQKGSKIHFIRIWYKICSSPVTLYMWTDHDFLAFPRSFAIRFAALGGDRKPIKAGRSPREIYTLSAAITADSVVAVIPILLYRSFCR